MEYDPKEISYNEPLDLFWSIHNPTTKNRQGPDIGSQYRSTIFYHTLEQERIARKLRQELGDSNKFENKIVTEITGIYILSGRRLSSKVLSKVGGGSCYHLK